MNDFHELTEYELRRQNKEDRREMQKKELRSKKVKYWLIATLWVLGIGGIVTLGMWLVVLRVVPEGFDYSTAHPIQGTEHIAEGSSHPAYNSNPPSSGWHYANPALVGFYDVHEKPPFDEQVIHNLEHGDVWIAYHTRIPEAVLGDLKQFDSGKVIITSREANDTDIALVAWGRVDAFNLDGGVLDTQRIENFIKRYANRGPERVGNDPTKDD